MSVYTRIAAVIAAIAVAASAVSAQGARRGGSSDPPIAKGVQPALSVVCDAQAALHVTVTNPGDADLSILLGFTPGTPQPQVVTALAVHAIRPATGATEEYVYINPKYAAYTGRMDPWIVALKAGASVDVSVNVRDFISTMNFVPLDASIAATAQLVLNAKAVAKQPGKVWTGQVEAPIGACG